MKYLRYLIYFIIISVVFYFVSQYITKDKELLNVIIGFVIMILVTFPLMYLEFIKFQKK